jgi:D-aminopeptidase
VTPLARARDLGLGFEGEPGRLNAITDVGDVRVGHVTLISGDGPLVVGRGPVRTGVTVIVPGAEPTWERPVFAGAHTLNGNGEMTGLAWVRESGLLTTPIAITNTHSVGLVRDALIAAEVAARSDAASFWRLPVVAETWDGTLNDINGFHVTSGDLDAALASATSGPVPEGNVGGGTGMICHGFKGGVGTASRMVLLAGRRYCVGVLVQANHGSRARLIVLGAPVGRAIPPELVSLPGLGIADSGARGSIIAVVATDAPLLPHQLRAVAQRVSLGVGRTGGLGEHLSGDLFVAFSTANAQLPSPDLGVVAPPVVSLEMVPSGHVTPLYEAVVGATEEAIVNALVAAETMTGINGVTAHRLPHDLLAAAVLAGPSGH